MAELVPESFPADPLADLAKILMERGELTAQAMERALGAATVEHIRLDRALNQLGLVSDEALVAAWSAVRGLPIAQGSDFPDQAPLLDQLAPAFLVNTRSYPIRADQCEVQLALEDPLDELTAAAVAAKTGLAVRVFLARRADLDRAFQRLHAPPTQKEGETLRVLLEGQLSDDIERLRDLASDAPVIRLVNGLIESAVEIGASDIHITATLAGTRLRFRVDGSLRDIEPPPPQLHAAIISRIKIMAGLDIAERRLPQDGRIRAGFRGREVDFRVATMPHVHGEGVVLRLLDRTAVALNLGSLGLPATSIAALRHSLDAPYGMVLVTGPTGSGKTTTLYAALAEMHKAERNIVTIEDPVEYHLDGVNQIQVSRRIGLDFAQSLRAVLRQDPDVIMVGEIRDAETAIVATQAALTGHLVLATVHTNTAAGALPRLLDMGVEPFLLASTLRGVLAQRLVRRLCTECRRRAPNLPYDSASRAPGCPPVFYEPGGCLACSGTGYRGRLAVSEFLSVNDRIRESLIARADENSIAAIAAGDGTPDLRADGWTKAAAGLTSPSEVVRVTGAV